MDPRTGTIDMDMITTGTSTADRGALAKLKDDLAAVFEASLRGQRVHLADLRNKLQVPPQSPNLTPAPP